MSYQVTIDYRSGMPKTIKNQLPMRLIAAHDTEGGTGIVGAQGTISYLVSVEDTRNASYHELWAYDEILNAFAVVRIVPPTHCAHSVNPTPAPNGSYKPDAWVIDALGAGVKDPNQGVYAVSIAGRVVDVDRYATLPAFKTYARRRIAELRAEIPSLVGMAEHFRFNPSTRSDWGSRLTPALGGLTFNILTGEEMIIRNPTVTEQWITKLGVEFTRADGSKGSFLTPQQVTSHAEITMADGSDARLLDYGLNHQALIMPRTGLTPVPGTRIVGLPAGGYTTEQYNANYLAGFDKGSAAMKSKAVTAAQTL